MIAFIVDGQTEKRIVQKLCPGAVVRTTTLNGKDVSVAALAKASQSLIRLLKGRHFPVVILVDRESRAMPASKLEVAIVDELEKYEIDSSQVIVSCPDRMIENWMLADAECVRKLYGVSLDDKDFEGRNGKREMHQQFRNQERVYHELTVGVTIFTNLSPEVVAQSSPSFARLRHRAKDYCSWLRQML